MLVGLLGEIAGVCNPWVLALGARYNPRRHTKPFPSQSSESIIRPSVLQMYSYCSAIRNVPKAITLDLARRASALVIPLFFIFVFILFRFSVPFISFNSAISQQTLRSLILTWRWVAANYWLWANECAGERGFNLQTPSVFQLLIPIQIPPPSLYFIREYSRLWFN